MGGTLNPEEFPFVNHVSYRDVNIMTTSKGLLYAFKIGGVGGGGGAETKKENSLVKSHISIYVCVSVDGEGVQTVDKRQKISGEV